MSEGAAARDFTTRLREALGDAYRLEKELGGGGMSRVFLAEEVRLGRKVVVKVLPPEMSAGVNIERFEREILLAARLQHPHIVPLLSAGAQGDVLYYIMPYIEGESLRARLAREGEFPVRDVVQILKEVLDALHHAHAHGVVHRDIKPDNVMLSGRHALVTDFGVAKAVSESSGGATLTSLGVALGTPSYMAPEQAAGDPHVDHRADLYAVGAMAYEMLTGQPPFTGINPQAVLAKHITETPAAVTTHRSTVPPALNEIILRCLAKKPADRFQQADDLIPHLDALLTPSGGMTPTTAQPAAPARAPGAGRRPRWLLVAGAAIVTAGVVFALSRTSARGAAGVAGGVDQRPMLVVLPIQNLGPAEDQYFADGLTDEVTNRLGGVSGLGVISRSSAMKYGGANRDLRAIGRELGVQYALETTIRTDRGATSKDARQARVSADLIKVGDDTHVWTDRYTVALTPGQVFEVQAKIAEAVAGAMNVVLLEREKKAVGTRATDNPVAYEAYLKGSGFPFAATATEAQLREAEGLLQRAVAADSGFAAAYARLARVHLALFFFGFDPIDTRLPLAEAAIRRALTLQPDLPEGHLAKGYYHYWGFRDYAPALAEFERVRSARPSDAEAIAAASYILRRQGKIAEAMTAAREAARLDPRAAINQYFLGLCFVNLRDFVEAERYFRLALQLEPASLNAQVQLIDLKRATGDTARARIDMEALPAGNPAVAGVRRFVHMFLRDYPSALRDVEGLPAVELSQDSYLPRALARGLVFAQLGDPRAAANFDSAAAILRKELAKGPPAADEARMRSALSQALAGLGRRDEALQEGRRGTTLIPISLDLTTGGTLREVFAEVQAKLGDQAGAIAGLDSLIALPGDLTAAHLRLDPRWDPLRQNPAFQRLLARATEQESRIPKH